MSENLVHELNSLDFSSLIGGPIQAAITAQNNAALAQVEYIKSVGFNERNGGNNTKVTTIRMMEFSYREGSGSTEAQYSFSVPVLSLLNIPALRIDEMTIDFNAKLTSVETVDVTGSTDVSGSLGLTLGKIANLKASASYQKTTTTGSKVDKTYSMAIHVRVVNDEIPSGLEKLLTLMENRITDVPENTSED